MNETIVNLPIYTSGPVRFSGEGRWTYAERLADFINEHGTLIGGRVVNTETVEGLPVIKVLFQYVDHTEPVLSALTR